MTEHDPQRPRQPGQGAVSPIAEERLFSWGNVWFRWSVGSTCAIGAAAILVGFLVLPSMQGDYSAGSIWDSICKAAGVPSDWGDKRQRDMAQKGVATRFVLDGSMAQAVPGASAGRGATLAIQQCSMCHGSQGLSEANNAPNLAGQYPEVIIKQMHDFKAGARSSAVMQAMAQGVSDQDIADLAAYYTSLPKARREPVMADDTSGPSLVRVGDPLRNIAPCISCHGGIDHKLGTPWLEGMPQAYLQAQLMHFAAGTRRNDSFAQMRNMARNMTPEEITHIADFYARRGEADEVGTAK